MYYLYNVVYLQEREKLEKKNDDTDLKASAGFYHAAGIGLETVVQYEWRIKTIFPLLERSMRRFVTFAKAIPGFNKLDRMDQISLIKGKTVSCLQEKNAIPDLPVTISTP